MSLLVHPDKFPAAVGCEVVGGLLAALGGLLQQAVNAWYERVEGSSHSTGELEVSVVLPIVEAVAAARPTPNAAWRLSTMLKWRLIALSGTIIADLAKLPRNVRMCLTMKTKIPTHR